MPRSKKDLQNHVRRIESAYYYDAYRNLMSSPARDDSLLSGDDGQSNTSSEPAAFGASHHLVSLSSTPMSYMAPTTFTSTNQTTGKLGSTSTTGDGQSVPAAAQRSSSCSSGVLAGQAGPCVVTGNGNRPLAEAVALVLGVKTHPVSVVQYESGEVHIELHGPVIGRDVYIIQSMITNTVVDVNTAVMELLLLIRKIRLQHPKSISAIIPFFGYARQRKTNLRGAVPAAAVARMITCMGVDRVATVDLHLNQIQGYFDNVPLDNLGMVFEFAKYIQSKPWFKDRSKVCVVSPDAGGVERAGRLADVLQVDRIVTILKRRLNDVPEGEDSQLRSQRKDYKMNVNTERTTTMQTAGEVKGLHCIVVDDIVDTGTTLAQACQLLRDLGAASIMACCTHGSLCSPAPKNILGCDCLDELVVSDSIPQEEHQRQIPKLKVVSIAPLLAAVVRAYEEGRSLSFLFPKR